MKASTWCEGWLRMTASSGLAALLLTSGCQGLSGGGGTTTVAQGPPASPVQHTMLQNIPVPVGFRVVPERSVGRESGQFRVAQFEFEGSTNPDAVARFYSEYMPAAKFTLRQKRFDNGQYFMRFESDTEECNVRIGTRSSKTLLVIDVGPLPRGATEREPQPPPVPRR